MARLSSRLDLPLSVAACVLIFFLYGLPLIPLAGTSGHEFAQALPAVSGHLLGSRFMPLMSSSYIGSLKTWLLVAVFHLFGSSLVVLRVTSLAIGALGLSFCVKLAAEFFEPFYALLLGFVLATDPLLLTVSCFDKGPAAMTCALEWGGLWLLAGWWKKGRRRRLAIGGFLLGAALWEKAHFVWFLGALPIAVAVFFGRALWKRATGRDAAIFAGCLAAGAAPLLAFNLLHATPLPTLRETSHLSFREHWETRAKAWTLIADRPIAALSGCNQYEEISGSPCAPALARRFPLLLAALGVVLLVSLAAARGRSGARRAGFWLALSALVSVFAWFTPYQVKPHHFYLIYPFPLLALWAVLHHWERLRPTLVVVSALWLASNVAGWQKFQSDLARTGGAPTYARVTWDVWEWLSLFSSRFPGVQMWNGADLEGHFRFYSAGADSALLPLGSMEQGIQWPDNLVLTYADLSNPRAIGRAESLFSGLEGLSGESEAVFRRPLDEKAWIVATRVRGPVSFPLWQARAALRRGEKDAARRDVQAALRAWRGDRRRPFSFWLEPLFLRLSSEESRRLLALVLAQTNPADPVSDLRGCQEVLRKGDSGASGVCPAPRAGAAWSLQDAGVCEYQRGKKTAAERDFRLALFADPTAYAAYSSLGAVLIERGRSEEAAAVYRRALDQGAKSPDDPMRAQIRESLICLTRPKKL